jgi:CubicO group peptidase (beta-lactamase class C family)
MFTLPFKPFYHALFYLKKKDMRPFFMLITGCIFLLPLNAQTIYYPPLTGSTWDTISPKTLGYCQANIDRLYEFLEKNNTKAFLMLKNGKIVLEKYFGTHTLLTPWQWASAGKTITSFMVGMAQQEGYLSVNDTTSTYLGKGWTDCTPKQEEKITIRHQLTMTSGLDDKVKDHYCIIDTCLIYKSDAGTRWAYHNGPYTLLDKVIEKATGQTLNSYTTQKLKTPTGMTGSFIPVGYNNVYFSTARSMARFGLLILNKGKWGENQILSDSTYYKQMVNPSQNINKSYGYLWWLNGKQSYMLPTSQTVFPGFLNPNAPADMFVAMGKDGQFLNVIPGQQMVMVRMGEAPDNLPVPFLLNDNIWKYVNELQCATSATENQFIDETVVQVYPNPASELIRITSDQSFEKVVIFSVQGQKIKSSTMPGKEICLSVGEMEHGIYMIEAIMTNGRRWRGRFVKQ